MTQPTTPATTSVTPIAERVRKMYDAFPYPHYPLLMKLRWSDGVLASSWFNAALCRGLVGAAPDHHNAAHGASTRFLLAGCGETLPYIVRNIEPRATQLTCVDLSATSLQRARIRNLFSAGPTTYHADDINQFLIHRPPTARYDHIDSYGVLHHTASPSETIKHLAAALRPGGSMRIMVYNKNPRHWINHIKRCFALLGLSPYHAQDRLTARQLIDAFRRASPALEQKFTQMGLKTFTVSERFVDTFFHEREVFVDISKWWNFCTAAGLKIVGVFDRYAELDDLSNPLWQAPTVAQLEERAADGRFENNLELFLTAPGETTTRGTPATSIYNTLKTCQLKTKAPPSGWFLFQETRGLGVATRLKLWHNFLDAHLLHRHPRQLDAILSRLPDITIQRLARIGAILPQQLHSQELLELARRPIHATMEPPDTEAPSDLNKTTLRATLQKVLQNKNLGECDRRIHLAMQRLHRAQLSICAELELRRGL